MRQKKILLVLALAIVVLGMAGFGYVLAQKYFFKPHSTTAANPSGLPGKLLGPITNQKAKNLDPALILNWTNIYRAENNLPALVKNDLLTKAAQEKVNDMFKNQYFEHVSPDGTTPSQLVASVGYSYKVTGENLALGDFRDEKDLVDAWMNSPGHRANILNQDYTEIGVATGLDNFPDRGKTWLAVQEFGKPLPNCAKPDAETLNDINSKKTEYDSLNSQIKTLAAEAKTEADIAQIKTLQAQAETLYKTIQTESDAYNAQVSQYNTCIVN